MIPASNDCRTDVELGGRKNNLYVLVGRNGVYCAVTASVHKEQYNLATMCLSANFEKFSSQSRDSGAFIHAFLFEQYKKPSSLPVLLLKHIERLECPKFKSDRRSDLVEFEQARNVILSCFFMRPDNRDSAIVRSGAHR